MSDSTKAAGIELIVSRSAANERFRTALRLFVGRGKRFSVKQVSNGTGIKDRMIESFMAPVDSGEFRRPDFEEVLTLASFFGPDFTTEIISLAGQGAFWLPDADETPPGMLACENADDNAEITRAARKPETIKTFAREFLIDFPDYRPFARTRDKGAEVEPKTILNFGPSAAA